MKKFLSILLAAMMVLATAGIAFAEEETTYTIKIDNKMTGHTYEAYQIFKGDLSDGILSNIKWGDSVSAAGQSALGDAAAKAKTLVTTADATAFAKEVAPYLTTAVATTSGGAYELEVTAGYYFIKDSNGSQDDKHDFYTNYILKVSEDVTVTPKADEITIEKKVKDVNDSTGQQTGWQDSADYDVGDTVPFQLTSVLPDNILDFQEYYLQFVDTMSAGLTYKELVSVKLYDASKNEVDVTSAFTVEGPDSSNKLTFTCSDLLKLGTTEKVTVDDVEKDVFTPYVKTYKTVVVEFNATLNENAVIGSAGNPNEVHLVFSNNPNTDDKGKTKTDKVIVFTYKLEINKVNEKGEPLTDATFTLEKYDLASKTWKPVTMTANTSVVTTGTGDSAVEWPVGTVFTSERIDDGQYRIKETVTPNGYNTIQDIVFEIKAEHDETSDDPALKTLTGDVTSGEAKFTITLESGELSTTVKNNKGATLPSTGGIGTTLFYLIGGLMAAGSALTLVIRRRADADEE